MCWFFLFVLYIAPLPSLQIVALVVVHEISHQWFGDTITTPWALLFLSFHSFFIHLITIVESNFAERGIRSFPSVSSIFPLFLSSFWYHIMYIGTDYLFPDWDIYEQGGDNSFYTTAFYSGYNRISWDFPLLLLICPKILAFLLLPTLFLIISFRSFFFSFSFTSYFIWLESPITYGKGGSINMMMYSALSPPTWNSVVAYHIQKYQYTNPSMLLPLY